MSFPRFIVFCCLLFHPSFFVNIISNYNEDKGGRGVNPSEVLVVEASNQWYIEPEFSSKGFSSSSYQITSEYKLLTQSNICKKDRRFLLYDVKVGEGFNLQKEVFFRVAMAVIELNKKSAEACKEGNSILCGKWVLVLPPWCRLAHWRLSVKTSIPWRKFFDLKAAKDVLPLMDYDEFVTYANAGLEEVDFSAIFKFADDDKIKSYVRSKNIRECETEYTMFYDKEICVVDPKKPLKCTHPYSVGYSGYCSNIAARELWCYKVDFLDGRRAANAIWDTVAEQPSIHTMLLKGCDNFLVPWPHELRENQIIEVLLPSSFVRDLGDQFIKEYFSDGNFISAHIRSSDYHRSGRSPELDYAAKKLVYLIKEKNASGAFICTDGYEEEKRQLQEKMKGYKVYFYEKQLEHPGLNAIVEQWIAARAIYFVGTSGSRYSSAIRWERILSGHSFADSGDNFCSNKDDATADKICLSSKDHDPREFLYRSDLRKAYFPSK